jgi:hypothetical protein
MIHKGAEEELIELVFEWNGGRLARLQIARALDELGARFRGDPADAGTGRLTRLS